MPIEYSYHEKHVEDCPKNYVEEYLSANRNIDEEYMADANRAFAESTFVGYTLTLREQMDLFIRHNHHSRMSMNAYKKGQIRLMKRHNIARDNILKLLRIIIK